MGKKEKPAIEPGRRVWEMGGARRKGRQCPGGQGPEVGGCPGGPWQRVSGKAAAR